MSANRNVRHVSQNDVKRAEPHIIEMIAEKPWLKSLKRRTKKVFEDSKETRETYRQLLLKEKKELEGDIGVLTFLLHAYQVDRLRNNPKYGGDKFKWENCNAHIAMCEYLRYEGDPVKPVDSAKTTKTKHANKSAKSGRQATVKKSTETKEKPEHK